MQFNIEKIPSKITPCPIKEAIFELRFESNFPGDVLPGMLFEPCKKEFGDNIQVQRLPILDMPQAMRDSDPNLRYAAHYVYICEGYRFQIGPKSISLVSEEEYDGWDRFYQKIGFVIDLVEKLNIVQTPLRTGLRYINVFDHEDVFDYLKMDFALDGQTLVGQTNLVRSEFLYKDFVCCLNLSNRNRNALSKDYSLIDIDIIKDVTGCSKLDYRDLLVSSHEAEKEIFFSMLKNEYVEKCNPEYGA